MDTPSPQTADPFSEAGFRARARKGLLREPSQAIFDPRSGRALGPSDWDLSPEFLGDLAVMAPPRPIEIKLLKSPRNNAVQRSCNWLSALKSEVGSTISSAPKSSAGAVIFTVPLAVPPVALIELLNASNKVPSGITVFTGPTRNDVNKSMCPP